MGDLAEMEQKTNPLEDAQELTCPERRMQSALSGKIKSCATGTTCDHLTDINM